MKHTIQFLGSGSAFTTENYQSNIIIKNNTTNKILLIDCGGDARRSLKELGYKATDIDSVYISHLHADHTGGLEWLAFSTFWVPDKKIKLFLSGDLKSELWDSTLKGGLESIEGKIVTLDDYFDTFSVPKNGNFVWDDILFQLVQVVHIVNGFSFVPSYGLIFSINRKKVFLTTDTQFAPNQLSAFYNQVDIIFHDCETAYKSGVHSHYMDLKTLPENVKNKMFLYHYNDGQKPDCKDDGFAGWVYKHQTFDLVNLHNNCDLR